MREDKIRRIDKKLGWFTVRGRENKGLVSRRIRRKNRQQSKNENE